MLVQADRVFVTASPLSELVWSPRKGLGLKCTDSSSAENKTSLWWSTESFNIIISAPECSVGENRGDGTLPARTLSSTQLVPSSNSNNNMDVFSPGSVVPASCRTHEQNSTSCEEMERLQGTMDIAMIDINRQVVEQFEDKEAGVSSPSTSKRKAGFLDSFANIVDKVPLPGIDAGKNVGSLSGKPEGVRGNSEKVEAECGDSNEGSLHEHMIDGNKNSRGSLLIGGAASEVIIFKGYNSPEKLESFPRFIDCKHAEIFSDNVEDSANKKMAPGLTYFHPLSKQGPVGVISSDLDGIPCYQNSSFFKPLSETRFNSVEVGTSEPPEDLKGGIRKLVAKEKSTIVLSHDKVENIVNSKKGKERFPDPGENVSILKDKDNSQESVESSNSKEFSTGKRPWCFESEKTSESKRLKKISNENSCSGPLLKQDSSFMNWISGMARGFPSSSLTETALALVPKTQYSMPGNSCPASSLDKNKDTAPKNTGFQSFVQALYHPKLKAPEIMNGYHDQREFSDYNELQVTEKSSECCGNHTVDKADVKLQQPVPLSTVRADQSQFGEFPATMPNVSSSDSPIFGKLQYTTGKHHAVRNWLSLSSSIRNGSTSPGDKETVKPDSAIPRSSNYLATSSGSEFLGSFWITRLCPRVVPLAYSRQYEQSPSPDAEMQVGSRGVYLPPPNEGQRCLENEDRNDAARNQEHSASPTDSFSSKGKTTDQMLKSRLNPIFPSERLKRLELMTSVFAKRLDAFRHIKTTSVVDDVIFSTLTCFFCGQTGHSLKECSEIKGSEVEDLQNNINSYEGPQKPACLCIRCFQLNHWAVTCPFASTKNNQTSDGVDSHVTPMNCEIRKEKPLDHTFTNDDARHKMHHGVVSNFGFLHNVITDVGDRALKSKQVKENPPSETKFKGKQILSFSHGTESRRNQIIPVYGFPMRKMFDEQIRIFEGIRGLQLCRSDLVRGMESLLSNFSLDGFYLRVQLGKNEEGIGEGGYQVACICGASREKSQGTSNRHIPVNIGSFKCLLDCRFVSNHDFTEDELSAWWSATLKSGGNLPTEEELTRKLQERKKFSF